MNSEGPKLSRLVYVGPPETGVGETHTLIMIEDGMATTWGDRGFSWHGPLEEMGEVFRPAEEGE